MIYDFEGQVLIEKERRYIAKNHFGIYDTKITKIEAMSDAMKDATHLQIDDEITILGTTAKLSRDECYLTGTLFYHQSFGYELKIVSIAYVVDDEPLDYASKKRVLSKLFTENQVKEMYRTYTDPYQIFLDGDASKLTKIKGCGYTSAAIWMERFNSFIPTSKIYLGLAEFRLSNNIINKLLDKYKDPDIVIQTVKANPYCLCNIEGIGWATADKIALNSGMSPQALPRVESYMYLTLDQKAQDKGKSYCQWNDLTNQMIQELGDVPEFCITEAFQDLLEHKVLYWDAETQRIGLWKYWRLENLIAEEVLRLLDSPPLYFNPDAERIKRIIHRDEQKQGWTYTEEQLQGLKTVLENNFVIITGSAGTGKSSLVSLILSVFGDRDYEIAQTALSGRAAARLSEVTHQEGSTIHRLLGFPKGEKKYQHFLMNQDNHLSEQIIVVDEISMIGGNLFYQLLRAIQKGAKVILLGDTGQLEPIGVCNVAHDLLACGLIPTVTLTQIQRQAEQSAIVTESNKVRQGIQIIKAGDAGIAVRGNLRDLILVTFSDKSNTFGWTVQYFNRCLDADPDILNTQVLVPINVRGVTNANQLNLTLQHEYSEKFHLNNEDTAIRIFKKGKQKSEEFSYGIRVGDKVMNTQNNYKVPMAYDEDTTVPVFNGNIGIVVQTDPDNRWAIIDFMDIGKVLISGDALRNIVLAYATTVHKYQGSECDNVIIALDSDTPPDLCSREMVYTAITRAKKKCILIAQNSTLRRAVHNCAGSEKATFLAEILQSRVAPKEKLETNEVAFVF